MSFRCLSALLVGVIPAMAADQGTLHVCADPNNMPYSNQAGQGFENKLAEVAAAQLHLKLDYTWWAQRKSFVKNSLDEGRCDAMMGIPTSLDTVEATVPYYRSTYVFVSRHDRNLQVQSLADPRLSEWRIGVHIVDDNFAPPAAALAQRGITKNVTGFSLFGEYGEQDPPRKLIDAVAHGDIDVAIVWGPFAGYFAKQEKNALDIIPVSPPAFMGIPFRFEMSMGVRKGNGALKDRLNSVLQDQAVQIQQILSDYGVPQVQ